MDIFTRLRDEFNRQNPKIVLVPINAVAYGAIFDKKAVVLYRLKPHEVLDDEKLRTAESTLKAQYGVQAISVSIVNQEFMNAPETMIKYIIQQLTVKE